MLVAEWASGMLSMYVPWFVGNLWRAVVRRSIIGGEAKGWIQACPGQTQPRSWCLLGGLKRREVGMVGVTRWSLHYVDEGADASGALTTYATKSEKLWNVRLPRYRNKIDKSVFRLGKSIHRNIWWMSTLVATLWRSRNTERRDSYASRVWDENCGGNPLSSDDAIPPAWAGGGAASTHAIPLEGVVCGASSGCMPGGV